MKPEGSKVNYQELAERFYTLDTEVYGKSVSWTKAYFCKADFEGFRA